MRQIDEEVRHSMMELVHLVGHYHPPSISSEPHGKDICRSCPAVTEALTLLDAEQRQYGPAIDVTDPSYSPVEAGS